MKIRRYSHQDWPRLCEIHDGARRDELRGASLDDAFLPLEVAAEREDLFGYELLVAESNATVVGFAAYSHDELAWLYVDPQCYRSGIGRALVQAATAASSGAMSVQLLNGNTAALAFYKKCGFVESRTLVGSMPGNEAYAVSVHELQYVGRA